MARLSEIWRYPIKAHGREALSKTMAVAGTTLPGDRRWAVAHEAAKLSPGWNACQNFTRAAKAPALMALSSHWDEAAGTVTLSHPDLPALTFDPDRDTAAFLDWIAPLMPADRAHPTAIIRREDRGLTDTDFPSISLCGFAANEAVGAVLGAPISHHRWRGNLWVEGLAPWEEFDWVGRDVSIGAATFHVRERITRCRATMSNPETGQVDADTLGALNETFGHQNFGVYLTCTESGTLAAGDTITLL